MNITRGIILIKKILFRNCRKGENAKKILLSYFLIHKLLNILFKILIMYSSDVK